MDNIVKPGKVNESWRWVVKMAWQDSRKNRARLFIFILSIALGIGALVGINSFKVTLVDEINDQAKELLGADLALGGQLKNFQKGGFEISSELPGESSFETSFASMVFFPRTDGTRLVNVRALKGAYPYYGRIETAPAEADSLFRTGQYALVDESVMLQFNVDVGDQVKVGEVLFEIVGKIQKVPGQTEIGTTVAPIVYIPYEYLLQTELDQKGSRIQMTIYHKIEGEELVKELKDKYSDNLDKIGIYMESVEDRKRDAGRAFGDLAEFLNLVAFVALLLGCIGVSSSVFVYVKEKIKTVAILRCLGASANQVFFIFMVQILMFGLLGSLMGASAGVIIQSYLPTLLEDFIPVSITSEVSWISVFQGIALGIFISMLFTLLPLFRIRKVTPMGVIREVVAQAKGGNTLRIVIYSAIFLFIFLFSRSQIGSWLQALYFSMGVV
ncbi:MAG: FtsX-like permease family protein, partial [Bacteroidota bacterium]